jgi:tetratricopeptide (TPR) repeat protein
VACHKRTGYRKEDIFEAIGFLERAVALDPNFALAWSSLSLAQSDLYLFGHDRSPRRRMAAQAATERALQLEPELPQAHLALGMFRYRCQRDYEGALSELKFVVRHMPNDAQSLLYLAAIQRRQGDEEAFLEIVTRAARLSPRDAELPFNLGVTNFFLRRWEEMRRCLDRAIAIEPNNDTLWRYRTWFSFMASGDREFARRNLAGATPDEHRFVIWKYWVERLDRDYSRALDVIKVLPDGICDSQYYVYSKPAMAALIYHLQGNPEKAREDFEKARGLYEERIRELPNDDRVHGVLAIALAFLGDKEGALREGAEAERLCPVTLDHTQGTFRMCDHAYALVAVGEVDRAVEKLERLLSTPSVFSSNWIRLDPLLDPIREHPRYPALLETGRKPF